MFECAHRYQRTRNFRGMDKSAAIQLDPEPQIILGYSATPKYRIHCFGSQVSTNETSLILDSYKLRSNNPTQHHTTLVAKCRKYCKVLQSSRMAGKHRRALHPMFAQPFATLIHMVPYIILARIKSLSRIQKAVEGIWMWKLGSQRRSTCNVLVHAGLEFSE